ncbi:MAG TPA: sigma-54 dependent transcriptional regulator [Terriglobia bacterium]|nr:sigma-54 dependent transcriptional regulator [Terriglobia bacterium]
MATNGANPSAALNTHFRGPGATRRLSVLVVDHDAARRGAMVRVVQGLGHKVLVSSASARAREALGRSAIDIVVHGFQGAGEDGMDLLRRIKAAAADVEVILVGSSGSIELAVEAMKAGAYDFVVNSGRRMTFLTRVVERAAEHQRLKRAFHRRAVMPGHGIPVYASPQMVDIMKTVGQVSDSVATVLISGESGTGKEVVAEAIHASSSRRGGPLIKLSCAALPESLLESELFGHERGAFTGAREEKAGRFELAHGGTLFLDEIGELSPAIQVKLLRVLQNGRFERLGGTRTIQSDVRIVAATNKDLQREIAEQRFRVDLYYRLNVVDLRIPPLRARREDIPPLAAHFLDRYAEKCGKDVVEFSPASMRALISYHWPGNVRELENAIERAVVFTNGAVVPLSALPFLRPSRPHPSPRLTFKVGMRLVELERQAIGGALAHARGNKPVAARLLGVGLRTIYRRFDEDSAARRARDQRPFREVEAMAAAKRPAA